MDTLLENWAFKEEIMNSISDKGKRWNWKDLGASVWGRLVLIMLFTPSPSRLEKRDHMESHMGKLVIWMLRDTIQSWLETAAVPAGEADWTTGTGPVWSSKGMCRDWWVWQPNTVNYRKALCVFWRNVSPVTPAGLVQNVFSPASRLKYQIFYQRKREAEPIKAMRGIELKSCRGLFDHFQQGNIVSRRGPRARPTYSLWRLREAGTWPLRAADNTHGTMTSIKSNTAPFAGTEAVEGIGELQQSSNQPSKSGRKNTNDLADI